MGLQIEEDLLSTPFIMGKYVPKVTIVLQALLLQHRVKLVTTILNKVQPHNNNVFFVLLTPSTIKLDNLAANLVVLTPHLSKALQLAHVKETSGHSPILTILADA